MWLGVKFGVSLYSKLRVIRIQWDLEKYFGLWGEKYIGFGQFLPEICSEYAGFTVDPHSICTNCGQKRRQPQPRYTTTPTYDDSYHKTSSQQARPVRQPASQSARPIFHYLSCCTWRIDICDHMFSLLRLEMWFVTNRANWAQVERTAVTRRHL